MPPPSSADGAGWAAPATIAKSTPLYGLNQLVHAPLVGSAPAASTVLNALIWLAIFAGGAVWRFRRDTARV